MYNTHPSYQHSELSGGQYICQKRRRAYVCVYVIVSCRQEVVWTMALVAGGNERMTTRSDVT